MELVAGWLGGKLGNLVCMDAAATATNLFANSPKHYSVPACLCLCADANEGR